MAQRNEDVPEDTEKTRLDSSKDTKTEYEYVPPDGGWGWLVLGGSVMVSLLIPGTIKCFGILFVEFIDVFKATPVTASWIPAITYFLYCSLGPLASYLSTKYSYRTVTLIGGVFAATGMISSVFATNIVHLYICYGILVGTGAGLSFPPGVFIVTSYFVRLRGLANGVAISGSALGSIILPPFLRFLLETYGFRGAVLIMGGLILNVLVGASLYDPVQQHLKKIPLDPSKKNKHSSVYYVEDTVEGKKNSERAKSPEEKGLLERVIHESCDVPVEAKEVIVDNETSSPKKEFYMPSVNNQISDCSSNPILKNGVSHLSLSRPMTNSESVQQLSRKISTGSYRGRGSYLMGSTGQLGRKVSAAGPRPLPKVASSSAMSRKVSVTSNLSSSSFRYISTHFHGSTLVGINPEFSSQINIKATQQNPTPKPSCFSRLCSCFRSKKSVEIKVQTKTKDGVYRELLRDPAFIIILVSNATTAIGYTNFTIMLPSYAISLGFDKDKSSYLLSVVSALDLVGRVGGSALSDWLPIGKKYYYISGLFFSGISLMALPFSQSYSSLAFICGAFGLASGTYVGITAIVIVELLGEDRLASSYGVSLFINGILQLIGPPICNIVFVHINSYGPIIMALGGALIFGAAVWGYLPLSKKNNKKDQMLV